MSLTVEQYKNLSSSEQKQAMKQINNKISKISKKINIEFDEYLNKQIPTKIIELNTLSQSIPNLFVASESIKVNIMNNTLDNNKLKNNKSPPRKRRKLNGNDIQNNNNNNNNNNNETENKIWFKKAQRSKSEIFRLKTFVEINKSLQRISNLITKEIICIINITTRLKMCVSLKIPSIQEGNNFGVEIQEDIVDDLSRNENGALDAIEQISNYYQIRSKSISKILKWPYVNDYRYALHEFDKSHLITLKSMTIDLRNNYIVLHDTITKNIEKLKNPREERSKYYLY
eukprot:131505_1